MTTNNWTFTWNNYLPTDVEHLKSLSKNEINYIIFGKEIGEIEKTPHLQGYVEFVNKIRLVGAKKILDPTNGKLSKIHLEEKKAKNRIYAINYCKKGEQPKEEWELLNIKGPSFGLNADITEIEHKTKHIGQGKRSDWHEFYEFAKKSKNLEEIRTAYPDKVIPYMNNIKNMLQEWENEDKAEKIKDQKTNIKLHQWQLDLIEELKNEPHWRKVIWYVDLIGNTGKSTLAGYLLETEKCAIFRNGRSADISQQYNGERIVIFDYARSVEERINYEIFEDFKNGFMVSTKYESKLKNFLKPHLIVFANFEPKKSALSIDKWDIRYINKDLTVSKYDNKLDEINEFHY